MLKRLVLGLVLVCALGGCKSVWPYVEDTGGAIGDSAPQAGAVIKDAATGNWGALTVSGAAFITSVIAAYTVRRRKRETDAPK